MSELLPCPFCGGEAEIVGGPENWTPTFYDPDGGGDPIAVVCKTCACGLHFFDGYAEAIAAWNRRANTENKPLTLDELRQMDGEPVWVVTLDGTDEPRWEIVVSVGKCGIDLICVLNGVETRDYADFDLYNDTWLAYRNKPVKEEHYEAD